MNAGVGYLHLKPPWTLPRSVVATSHRLHKAGVLHSGGDRPGYKRSFALRLPQAFAVELPHAKRGLRGAWAGRGNPTTHFHLPRFESDRSAPHRSRTGPYTSPRPSSRPPPTPPQPLSHAPPQRLAPPLNGQAPRATSLTLRRLTLPPPGGCSAIGLRLRGGGRKARRLPAFDWVSALANRRLLRACQRGQRWTPRLLGPPPPLPHWPGGMPVSCSRPWARGSCSVCFPGGRPRPALGSGGSGNGLRERCGGGGCQRGPAHR